MFKRPFVLLPPAYVRREDRRTLANLDSLVVLADGESNVHLYVRMRFDPSPQAPASCCGD